MIGGLFVLSLLFRNNESQKRSIHFNDSPALSPEVVTMTPNERRVRYGLKPITNENIKLTTNE